MGVTNITIVNVTKGFNLAGQVNELRYEISADVAPDEFGGPQQFTFEIPNATLVTDAQPPPSTTTGNPPSGGGGGGAPSGASVIAAIASAPVDVIFPSLLSKIAVSTVSDEEARSVLFRTPGLHVRSRADNPAVSAGLDVIPGGDRPGILGTVTVAPLIVVVRITLSMAVWVQSLVS